MKNSVIKRADKQDFRIKREPPPKQIRDENEVQAAYKQVGYYPSRNTKSWYRDIYDFYQNNEV